LLTGALLVALQLAERNRAEEERVLIARLDRGDDRREALLQYLASLDSVGDPQAGFNITLDFVAQQRALRPDPGGIAGTESVARAAPCAVNRR
jgi:hypothetical protein